MKRQRVSLIIIKIVISSDQQDKSKYEKMNDRDEKNEINSSNLIKKNIELNFRAKMKMFLKEVKRNVYRIDVETSDLF